MAHRPSPASPWKRTLYGVLLLPAMLVTTYFGLCVALLGVYTTFDPPTTGVQIQRRLEAMAQGADYTKRYDSVPADAIAQHLRHAAVAAEDARFYEHAGVDWRAVRKAIEDNQRRGRTWRGGSTITQQLVKNLFQTTHSSYVRKALELPLTYAAEALLSKDRILTLYLNVIEWGDGVYGAEAASRYHYGRPATDLTRTQAAALAACIPNPRARTPQRMTAYRNVILTRMRQMGW